MTQTGQRPSAGARYVLERVGPGDTPAVHEAVHVYRGLVHLPAADVPVEVRVSEGAAAAEVAAEAIPDGGPSAAELQRTAAALVRTAVRSAASNGRPAPLKVVRWRG